MKILVVSNMFPNKNNPSYGTFVRNFCDQLNELNIEYDLAVMTKTNSKIKKLKKYIEFYIVCFFKIIFRKYDLIYVHYASHSSLGVLLASKFKNIRIFTNVHGSDVFPENKKQQNMQKYTQKILNKSDKIIVPSDYFKETVTHKYNIEENRIFVSPSGGVDTRIFFDTNKAKTSSIFTIGYVGRLSYKKGWDILVKACSMFDFKYKLIIVGDGPERQKLLECIEKYNIQDFVELRGLLSQKELCEIYNEMDVFVFPTQRDGESLGLVSIEAMACGTPVIASDYAAPAKYIIDGYNGFKFAPGNVNDLANKIKTFKLLDTKEIECLILGAKETAKKYSKEAALRSMDEILRG